MMMEPKGPGGHSSRGSHRLAQAGTCERKWYLRWARGLKPNKSPIYFLEGSLAHIALAYYRANQLHTMGRPVPAWFFEESMQDCLIRNGEGFPDAVALGNSIFQAYHQRYSAPGCDAWNPIAIEEEYKATLGQIRQLIIPGSSPRNDDSEVVTSRIDLMLRTNGKLWACDYKTTKHAYRGHLSTFNYEGEFFVNWQFLLQTAILRVNFGTDFAGVIVERCLKGTPHDFDRTPAPINNEFYRSVPGVLSKLAFIERDIARRALAAQEMGVDMETWLPEASPWACFSWGQPCEYRLICSADGACNRKETVVREYHPG